MQSISTADASQIIVQLTQLVSQAKSIASQKEVDVTTLSAVVQQIDSLTKHLYLTNVSPNFTDFWTLLDQQTQLAKQAKDFVSAKDFSSLLSVLKQMEVILSEMKSLFG